MTASNTDALSIAQAIELLEAPLAEIRKEMPEYVEPLMIVPESGDVDLLSEFIDGVNLELDSDVLVQLRVVALDSSGFSELYAKIMSAVPFALIWAGIRRYCGVSRCSLKVKVGDREIDVSAATPEEAERLFNIASRVTVYRINDSPPEEIQEANKARLDNRP